MDSARTASGPQSGVPGSEERYLVLGTAGHIDHGKTSLVRALTGVDTDRLTEEKARGITIDLGFASWLLPDGTRLGIIDVPGHRRFIRNMVAGAAGIDLIMLVVAADDGVMPQTVEHLQIARMLGVSCGLIALTKADVVEPDLLELARADVESLIAGTFLEGAPIVPVSSVTGAGLDELTSATMRVAADAQSPLRDAPLRLPIDRAFTIRGAGTVVTGTLITGTVRVDDELVVMPAGRRVRVRGLQLHGESVSSIGPRHRAALNLVGVDRVDLRRGDVLAAPDSLEPTEVFDARIELLPGRLRPLRQGSWVEVHLGTAEVGAKLVPLDMLAVQAGSSALVQLRLEAPLALAAGDHFILRGSTGETTIGGGVVLDAHPAVHRRTKAAAAQRLAGLDEALLRDSGEPSVTSAPADSQGSAEGELPPTPHAANDPLLALLRHEVAKALFGLSRQDAARRLNVSDAQVSAAAAQLEQSGLQVHRERGEVYTLPENRARIGERIQRTLAAYHAAHPLRRRGLSSAEVVQSLSGSAGRIVGDAVRAALEELLAGGALKQVDGTWALKTHAPRINAREEQAAAELARRLDTDLSPQQPEEALAELGLTKERLRHVLDYMREEGLALLAPGGVWFGPQQVERARAELRSRLSDGGGVTVSDFNALLGTTRKYGIPLLQLLEAEGTLVRDGDLRRLRR